MRLDRALVERGMARSRTQAARLIQDGRVQVNGVIHQRPAHPIEADDTLTALQEKWVSRAAHKLLGALDAAEIELSGRVLDAGASTGGFTQVCLERGAEHVYAVDVGHDQIADEIRTDPRVTVAEGLNLRDLTLDDVGGEPVDAVVADVSFISMTLILEPLLRVLAPSGTALLLVKPQFEVGKEKLGRGGIVRDPDQRRAAVDRVSRLADSLGWHETWRGQSVLPGSGGNVEFFVALTR